MSTVVIYHANCSDGFCAAWLFSKLHPNATFIPAQYGAALPPIMPEDDVFILDFSYPREVLIDLSKRCKSLLVLDHHKSAEKDCKDLPFCKFDMDKSGAMLALEYLVDLVDFDNYYSKKELVRFIQDRDLWKLELPFSKEINSAIRSYPMDFVVWDTLCDRIQYRGGLVIEGTAIERYRGGIIREHVNRASSVNVAGYTVQGCYCSFGEVISEVAGELAKNKLFGCCWFDLSTGERVYSLRSDEHGLDVSVVAESQGGGGHIRAAGFKTLLKGA